MLWEVLQNKLFFLCYSECNVATTHKCIKLTWLCSSCCIFAREPCVQRYSCSAVLSVGIDHPDLFKKTATGCLRVTTHKWKYPQAGFYRVFFRLLICSYHAVPPWRSLLWNISVWVKYTWNIYNCISVISSFNPPLNFTVMSLMRKKCGTLITA